MIKMNVREGRGGWCAGLLLVILGFFLAGCASPTPNEQFADNGSAGSAAATSGNVGSGPAGGDTAGAPPEIGTKIQVGDSLTVTFADLPPPPLNPFERVVREDGTITLLHNLTFAATNKTTGELESDIHKEYVPRYYPSMTVTVSAASNSRFYYVLGAVQHADRFIYLSRTTVLKAIASAGGFNDFANRKRVKLTRLGGRVYTINCVKAITDPGLDLEVFPGDRIYVPKKLF